MKKIKIIIMAFFICLFTSLYNEIYADDVLDENIDEYSVENNLQEVSIEPSKIPNINSRAAIIFDRTSKRVLYGKEENMKRPMASTTKIMTAIVVLENSNLSDIVEVSKKAAGTGGSRLGLKTGDKITVRNLLYGLMLCSGNDAAVALAEYIGGSVESFADLMNKKAKELGLENSSFVTPHGLDSEEHYTTAFDLAKMTDYALNIKEFLNIVGTKNYTVYINETPKNLINTNELLGNLSGVYGVKTGFTNGANRCLVTATKRENMDIICVVLGADAKKYRTNDSIKLIEYAFSSFKMVDLKKIAEDEFENWKMNNYISVIKGKKAVLDYDCDFTSINNYPISKEEIENIKIQINTVDEIDAPVYINDGVGELRIILKDKELLKVSIVAKEYISKKNIYDYFKKIISGYNEYIEEVINN